MVSKTATDIIRLCLAVEKQQQQLNTLQRNYKTLNNELQRLLNLETDGIVDSKEISVIEKITQELKDKYAKKK